MIFTLSTEQLSSLIQSFVPDAVERDVLYYVMQRGRRCSPTKANLLLKHSLTNAAYDEIHLRVMLKVKDGLARLGIRRMHDVPSDFRT